MRRTAMMQYLSSVHSVEGEVREPMSAESATQIGILEEELKSAGAWVFPGRLPVRGVEGAPGRLLHH
jgi:hypothetical protein